MSLLKSCHRILLVSAGTKTFEYFTALLPQSEFSLELCSSAGEARRLLIETPPDILIIDTPLGDEFGIELARSAAELPMGVMLLVKADIADKAAYDVEDVGALVLAKPNARQAFYGSVRLLTALSVRLKKMETKNKSLQEKMADIRAVNRAKWLLIDKMNMSEQDAHYFIEKRAMDARISRREVAESIIRTYDA